MPTNAPAEVVYTVEELSDLSGVWSELAVRVGNGGWVGPGFAFEGANVDGFENQQVYSRTSIQEEDRNFYRLRVELIEEVTE